MKLVGIGDLFIPCPYIEKGMAFLRNLPLEIQTVSWDVKNFDALQKINLDIETHGPAAFDPPDDILRAVADADILITQFFPVNEKLLAAAPHLKVIGVLRAGYENIDLSGVRKRGITLFHTPGRNAQAVSDFAVGMMICEARNIARGHMGIKSGQWIRNYPNSADIPDFCGRTVGIVGYGEIGRLVHKKLSGFDMNVLIYDPFVHDVPTVSLDRLMAESDFITIHARLTADNSKMIGAHELSLMKPTAYLINTSRSGLIDENALYQTLLTGKIAGAALDVFDEEPPGAEYPLVTLPNVTLTPHMAGGSQDAFRNTPKRLADDMIHFLTGHPENCRFIVK